MEVTLTPMIDNFCKTKGLEAAPFKLEWYNSALTNEKFRLTFAPEDSLCYVIISQPSMFEKAFLPFVKDHWSDIVNNAIQDPLDQCMKSVFEELKNELQKYDHQIEKFHDFEMSFPGKRPKVLVQTAGHVSGAVRFYQESDTDPNHLHGNGKVFPVCMHPKFGGWFALRGIFVFPNICVPHLERRLPEEILESSQKIGQLLDLYNYHWRDNRFRDCPHNVEERYSQDQQDYFEKPPGPQRIEYLAKLFNL